MIDDRNRSAQWSAAQTEHLLRAKNYKLHFMYLVTISLWARWSVKTSASCLLCRTEVHWKKAWCGDRMDTPKSDPQSDLMNMMKTSARLALTVSGLLGSVVLSLAQTPAPSPVQQVEATPSSTDSPAEDQPANTPPPAAAAPTLPADDGLMRDTLEKASRPQPPPPANASAKPRRLVKHRQRLHASASASRDSKEKPAVAATHSHSHPARHRNPVARFVFWWNGWVIKTFHTKVGTVMLGTIGAKS